MAVSTDTLLSEQYRITVNTVAVRIRDGKVVFGTTTSGDLMSVGPYRLATGERKFALYIGSGCEVYDSFMTAAEAFAFAGGELPAPEPVEAGDVLSLDDLLVIDTVLGYMPARR